MTEREYSTIVSRSQSVDDSTILTEVDVDVDPSSEDIEFLQWTLIEIEDWLINLQFDYDLIRKFTENNVTGEILPYLKDEHMLEMGIELKDRIRLKLEINKLVFSEKKENNLLLNEQETNKLIDILTNVNSLVNTKIEKSSNLIIDEFNKFKEDFYNNKLIKPLPTPDKNSTLSPFNLSSPTKNAGYLKHSSTSTSPKDLPSNNSSSTLIRKPSDSSSQRNSMHFNQLNQQPPLSGISTTSTTTPNSIHSPSTASLNTAAAQPPAPPVSEPLKQLRASTDDPCSKILQAAMKRHKLNDDWRNYALVICYGDCERILGLDEKPVMIFKELKEKGEHPAIMLRQKAEFNGAVSATPGGKL